MIKLFKITENFFVFFKFFSNNNDYRIYCFDKDFRVLKDHKIEYDQLANTKKFKKLSSPCVVDSNKIVLVNNENKAVFVNLHPNAEKVISCMDLKEGFSYHQVFQVPHLPGKVVFYFTADFGLNAGLYLINFSYLEKMGISDHDENIQTIFFSRNPDITKYGPQIIVSHLTKKLLVSGFSLNVKNKFNKETNIFCLFF